jgi:hypothetical protein
MSGPVVTLDFAAPRGRTTPTAMALLGCGLLGLGIAVFAYQSLSERHAGLELKLAAATRPVRHDPADDIRNAHAIDEAADVATELGMPWTALLADLELASRDSESAIALLGIEPDPDKHRVRISGESHDLAQVLSYLSRLQATHALAYPMLDSHEVVADDKEHPVRFTLTADWRAAP